MTVIILIAVIVILAIWIVSLYNSLVKLRNNRENAFADIDVQLNNAMTLSHSWSKRSKAMPHTRKRP